MGRESVESFICLLFVLRPLPSTLNRLSDSHSTRQSIMLRWPTIQAILEMLGEILKPHIAAHPNMASKLEEITRYLSNTTLNNHKPEILHAL